MMILSSQFRSIVYTVPLFLFLVGCGSSVDDIDDPVIDSTPIAYVERAHLVESDDNGTPVFFESNRVEPAAFFPGATLMLRRNAAIGASAEHLFATKLCDRQGTDTDLFLSFCNSNRSVKPYDVKDIAVSHDAETIVFAVRPPVPEDNNDPDPTWDLWKYSFETDVLEPVMTSQAISAIGDEVAPAFLPDGQLIFSSNLQQRTRALLLDEGKSQYQGLDEDRNVPALLLHRMDLDGNQLIQLSFNLSHDLDPEILSSGRIIFSRWDNMGSVDRINLYTMKPDGSDVQIHYGAHSHGALNGRQLEFLTAKPANNDQLLVQSSVIEPEFFGTEFLMIDAENYTDTATPVYANAGATGPGQAVPNGFSGQFASASPLNDGTGRVLAVWSPCRLAASTDASQVFPCTDENLADTALTQAPPLYGLWMFDTTNGSQSLIEAGSDTKIATEAVVVASRSREPIVAPVSSTSDYSSSAAAENLAVLHIRSVYDIAGLDSASAGIGVLADPLQTSPTSRPFLSMRIVKGVRLPSNDVKRIQNADFGISRQQLMRELIGYTPVEPDGSVKVLVPAEVPLAISFLNTAGERTTGRHQSWLEFAPGEVFECSGCHSNTRDERVHGRRDAEPPSANIGAAAQVPFPNSVPSLVADIGETMAETWSRINGVRRPTVDLVFNDDWTDPAVTTPATAVTVSHDDLTTESPLSPACIGIDGTASWSPLCRVQIHYPTHIEPLWSLDRQALAADGITMETQTCNSCHSRRDSLNELQVPAGQLELSADASPQQARHSISYRELLANDSEVEVRDGALQDVLVPILVNGEQVPVLDIEGEPVVDINGDPVVETTTVNVSRTMNVNGSRSSQQFFNVMAGSTSTDHSGFLSEAELFLLREWLDMGGQYYNDPFATP